MKEYAPLYLRDLADDARLSTYEALSDDLQMAAENGEDVVVGYYLRPADCHTEE